MVLQFSNVFIEKFDLNDKDSNNNNYNNDSDGVSEGQYPHNYGKSLYSLTENMDQTIEELFEKSNIILYDCDHLISADPNNYLEDNNEDNTREDIQLIESLRKRHKKIIFTSNRSDKTRQQMLIQLNSLGIKASINEMFPTSYTTAIYLKAIGFEREVFVVGSVAIEQELHNVGIQSTGNCCHTSPNHMNPGFATFNLNPKVGAVVVSFDQHIPLPHLVKACSFATKRDCLFIVSNYDDRIYTDFEPTAQVSAIQIAANKGFIPMYRPHRLYYHCIRQIHPDFDLNKAVIITNRVSNDKNIGIKTILIETNVQNNVKSRKRPNDSIHYKPDYLFDSLSSLSKSLSN